MKKLASRRRHRPGHPGWAQSRTGHPRAINAQTAQELFDLANDMENLPGDPGDGFADAINCMRIRATSLQATCARPGQIADNAHRLVEQIRRHEADAEWARDRLGELGHVGD